MAPFAATMPALFIGHGSPMNALEDNAFTRQWRSVAAQIAPPRAIVCVSAHWTTRGTAVGGATSPETIHDFYGFPQALFDVRYPAPGDAILARQIAKMVKSTHVHIDPAYGLDHGSWSVLRVMYPAGGCSDVATKRGRHATRRVPLPAGPRIGAVARRRRARHRQWQYRPQSSRIRLPQSRASLHGQYTPTLWCATRFSRTITRRSCAGMSLGGDVARAVPTPEHYLPLLYILGMQRDGDSVSVFNETVQSSISMTSVQIGGA